MQQNISYTVKKTYTFNRAVLEFWDNGIASLKFMPETEIDLDLARQVFAAVKENQQSRESFYVLIDLGKYSVLSKEARELAASEEGIKLTRVSAVIVYSLAQRLVINFNASMKADHDIKVKAFGSWQTALAWLVNQRKNLNE